MLFSLKKKSVTLKITQTDKKISYGTSTIQVKKKKGVSIKKVTYKVANKKVAKVSKKGKVTAKKKGKTKVTVTVKYKKKGKTYTKKLTYKISVVCVDKRKKDDDTNPATPEVTPPAPEPTPTPSPKPTPAPTIPEEQNMGTISGNVIGKNVEGELVGLEQVMVTIKDEEKQVVDTQMTDANGSFITNDIIAGKSYYVCFEKQGYKSKEIKNILVCKNTVTQIEEKVKLLSQFISFSSKDSSKVKVIGDEIYVLEGTTATSVVDLISNIMGGTVTADGESAVIVSAEDTAVTQRYELQQKERPGCPSLEYHCINAIGGVLRYYVKGGQYGKTYDVIVSKEEITDFECVAVEDIISVTFDDRISLVEQIIAGEQSYSYIYVRSADSDSEFSSDWTIATYKSQDNEFDADDIP